MSSAPDNLLRLTDATLAADATGKVRATQLYAPYGGVRYSSGAMPTDYGFTGQHSDSTTGLDYYGARYYDPLAGQFTSADSVLPGDDPWSLSRYAYVAGNPLIRLDPTGHCWVVCAIVHAVTHAVKAAVKVVAVVADTTLGISSMISDVKIIFSGKTNFFQKVLAVGDLSLNAFMDVTTVIGVGEGLRAGYLGVKVAGKVGLRALGKIATHEGEDAVAHVAEHEVADVAERGAEREAEHGAACALSFAPSTLVATPGGLRTIASLKVGDQVNAYDPATGKASVQTVQHTLINHDNNLLAVTLRTVAGSSAAASNADPHTSKQKDAALAAHGAQAPPNTDETIQTTTNHPWLTADHGWILASFLHVGEPVRRVDGSTAIVVAVRAELGAAAMWDLTVSNAHTFAVGNSAYVVHNCGPVKAGDSGRYGDLVQRGRQYGRDGDLQFHHMPSQGLFGMTKEDGWAIAVETSEHAETRSYKWAGVLTRGIDAAGSLGEAYMRDARDLRSIAGTKYDDAIYKGFQYYKRLGRW